MSITAQNLQDPTDLNVYFGLPLEIISQQNLTDGQYSTLCYMLEGIIQQAFYKDIKSRNWFTQKQLDIAAARGRDKSTIALHLNALVVLGLLIKQTYSINSINTRDKYAIGPKLVSSLTDLQAKLFTADINALSGERVDNNTSTNNEQTTGPENPPSRDRKIPPLHTLYSYLSINNKMGVDDFINDIENMGNNVLSFPIAARDFDLLDSYINNKLEKHVKERLNRENVEFCLDQFIGKQREDRTRQPDSWLSAFDSFFEKWWFEYGATNQHEYLATVKAAQLAAQLKEPPEPKDKIPKDWRPCHDAMMAAFRVDTTLITITPEFVESKLKQFIKRRNEKGPSTPSEWNDRFVEWVDTGWKQKLKNEEAQANRFNR